MIRRRWVHAIVLSFALHLFMIMTCPYWGGLSGSKVVTQTEPLLFEFLQPEMPRQLIETGEASETPPDHPDFLSDRHSLASNPDPQANRGNVPFAEGRVALGSIQPQDQAGGAIEPDQRAADQDFDTGGFRVRQKTTPENRFTRDRLLGIQQSVVEKLPEPTYKEMESSVEKAGGVSFNTYAWEWAPYMFQLKEILRKNIFPPASFTRLGFGGAHLVRFNIARDGSLTGPELLGYEGDKVLTETSTRAIRLSAPFPHLPDDFPEKALEVTIQFRYLGKESLQ
jgi:hypothetical protein